MSSNHLIYKGAGCVAALLFMCAELRAEYAPPVKPEDFPRDVVVEGQNALKALPIIARDALIAQRLGLLFLETGSYGYPDETIYTSGKFRFYKQSQLACFVSGTGKLYNYEKDGIGTAMGKGRTREKNWVFWDKATQAMAQVGDEVIFAGSTRDVSRVVRQTARYWLNAMPRKAREAMLAYLGGMLYKKGESAYSSQTLTKQKKFTIDFKQKYVEKRVTHGAKFVDSKGEELSYDDVLSQYDNMKIFRLGRIMVIWCACLVGEDDILSVSADVKKLRANHKKKMQELNGDSGADAAKKADDDSEARKTTKTAAAETTRSAEDLKKLEAQRAACSELVNKLRNSLPHRRQSLFAWFLDLRFNGRNNFLASDGKEYDFWDEIYRLGGDWRNMQEWTARAGGIFPVAASFTQEVAEMRRLYYERDAKLMSAATDAAVSALRELKPEERAAWFAVMTGLLYTADGSAGMEWSDESASFKVKDDARFLTAEGREMSFYDTLKAANESLWNKAREAVRMQGVLDSVLQEFDGEYKGIWKASEEKLKPIVDKEVKLVKKTLKAMPAELRSAWLALLGECLYTPDGCGSWYHREGDSIIPVYPALFSDAEGTEIDYTSTAREKVKGFEYQWKRLLRLLERPHMQDALRSVYANELELMRAAAEKHKQERIRNFDAGY